MPTIDEAKQLWCPFARVILSDVAVNRGLTGNMHKSTGCLADGCMAWRWIDHPVGYCGLAGKPT